MAVKELPKYRLGLGLGHASDGLEKNSRMRLKPRPLNDRRPELAMTPLYSIT